MSPRPGARSPLFALIPLIVPSLLLLADKSGAAPVPKIVDKNPAGPAEVDKWRSERPSSGPRPKPIIPTYTRGRTKNGLTVLVAELHALPLVSFSLVSLGGAALDPKAKGGLAALSYSLLDEGGAAWTALEFSDAVADLGASFSSRAGRESGSVSITGLARVRDRMLVLLADTVQRPRFDPADFERLKRQALASIIQQRGSPQGLAFEHVPAMLYGADHPYGHPPSGTPETVQAIALLDAKAFLEAAMHPTSSALIAAGDVTLAEVVALAEQHFGGWKGSSTGGKKPNAVEAKPRKLLTLIHKDNSPQTLVLLGRPIFGRGHADETAMVVTNEVFGGSFASRLNMNLREDKGYTYGASSTPVMRRGAGALISYATVRQDVTAESLKEFFAELDRLSTAPPADEEVERAKTGLIRSLTGGFETTHAIAAGASDLFVNELPLDHYARQAERTEAITKDEVGRIIKTYFVPSLMQILLVGDSKIVAPKIEGLGLGELRLLRP